MKKTTAILLSVMMVMCFMPAMAFATDITDTGITIAAIPNQTYTGSEIKPAVTVTSGGATLVKDTDYVLTYSNNTSAGAAAVTVSGAGVVTGTTTVAFTILPKSIAGMSINIPKSQVVGLTVSSSAVVVKDGDKQLVAERDFIISPSATTLISGVNTLSVEGKGNYAGSASITYTGGEDINNCTVTCSPLTLTYNGNEQLPTSITVKNASGTALSPSYYSCSGLNNKNAGATGAAKLIIQGSTPYAGTTEVSFTISPKALTTSMIQSIDNTVAGNKPVVVLKDGSTVLKEGAGYDYEMAYSEAGSVGTVTITGKNNYIGNISKQYKIAASLNGATTALDTILYTYDGTAKTPSASVRLNNATLTKGIDYRIDYSNNVEAGTATATIVGINNYAGRIDKTYAIDRLDLSKCIMSVSPTNYTYSGSQAKPTVTLTYDGRNLSSYDYDIVYTNNIYAGVATATVYSKYNTLTNTFNTTGTNSKTFTIGGTSLSNLPASLSMASVPYTGKAITTPVVTIWSSSAKTKKLILGTDYTIAYSNNVGAGTATVTITGKGIYSGTQTLNFTITGTNQTVNTNYTKYTKYLTSSVFQLGATATSGIKTFTYTSSDPSVATVSATGVVTVVGTGIATITVATSGVSGYNAASKTVTVTVKPSKVTPRLYSTSKGKMRVRVTKNLGVTKYQIRYGRAGVYKYYYMTYANNSFTTQSKLFKGLKSGYKYFVKVRPYKLAADGVTKIYGNWSSVKSIRIK